MQLTEAELLELVELSAKPGFQAAYDALRGVFHQCFLAAEDGQAKVDFMQIQPHAQALLSNPAVVKVVAEKESALLDGIVTLPWGGTQETLALVGEQLSNLDTLNWAMGLAGHRPLGLQLVGEQTIALISLVRLFRAFGAVYRSVVMVREQKRLQDAAIERGDGGLEDEPLPRTEVH